MFADIVSPIPFLNPLPPSQMTQILVQSFLKSPPPEEPLIVIVFVVLESVSCFLVGLDFSSAYTECYGYHEDK